ncbi:MAG TPA: hypothetical protein VGN44_18405 [Candidatus Angelobacter sp.]
MSEHSVLGKIKNLLVYARSKPRQGAAAAVVGTLLIVTCALLQHFIVSWAEDTSKEYAGKIYANIVPLLLGFIATHPLISIFIFLSSLLVAVLAHAYWVTAVKPHIKADVQPKRNGAEDWAKLAAQFSGESQFVMATWNRWGRPAQERWSVDICTEKFRALLTKAGTMLIASPVLSARLSKSVRDTADPAERWLNFLKGRNLLEDYVALPETLDDGTTANIYSGHIRKLAQRSEAVCIECEASELV